MSLSSRRKLKLINNCLSNLSLAHQHLIRVILRLSMLWEVFGIFSLYYAIRIFNCFERTFCQKFHFVGPYDSNSHVFSGVCNNGTCQVVWIYRHQAFLVQTKISKKFRIFLEMRSQLVSWLISHVSLFIWISQNLFIFKKTSLRYKNFDVVVYREYHEVPIDSLENNAFHIDNVVGWISSLYHVVESLSTWVLDLEVFCRY